MFKNYLLTAWKVLLRRKFFTFVNLFGIAITLAVLTLVVAMFENYLRPAGAESQSDRMLEVSVLSLSSEDDRSNWVSEPGYRFMEEYILSMENPAMISLFGTNFSGTSFVDGQKYSLSMKYTDGNYWKMLTFDFIEGGPITAADNEQGRMVMVINRDTRDRLFGEREVVGETLVVNGQQFSIIGVVENEPELSRHAYANIWVPFTTNPSATWREQMMGGFNALLLANDKAGLAAIKKEYREKLDSFEYEDPSEFAVAVGGADNKLEAMAREFNNTNQEYDAGAGRFLGLLAGGMLVFMLLPSINMVNLNTSRILERAPEIGVRKAFGARLTFGPACRVDSGAEEIVTRLHGGPAELPVLRGRRRKTPRRRGCGKALRGSQAGVTDPVRITAHRQRYNGAAIVGGCKALIGVPLTLDEPRKARRTDAVSEASTRSRRVGIRLQILTAEGLLSGDGVDSPPAQARLTRSTSRQTATADPSSNQLTTRRHRRRGGVASSDGEL